LTVESWHKRDYWDSVKTPDSPQERYIRLIQHLTQRYNVKHIGIDKSGIGQGVFKMVAQFFPTVRGVSYSVEIKNRLVLKIKQLITPPHLIQWDS